jgi:hypothetical protein
VSKSPSVGIVYLARYSDGLAAFRRFADSYRRHPAGMQHDLIVIYKGFDQQSHLQEARDAFLDHPHKGIELQDFGFDIGSYLECSKRVTNEYLCFLNTHSEILAAGWVARLYEFAARSGVGIAGAMGSYESLRQSWELIQMFYWLYYKQGFPLEETVARYYVKFPEYLPPMRRSLRWRKLLPRKLLAANCRNAETRFEAHWEALLRGEVFRAIALFPKFPNPHIRSNAFMLRRDHLAVFDGVTIASKDDACFFESGPNSLTAQIRRAGQSAIVVGRNGQSYDVPEWPYSATFRLGDQANLLVTDNHGRGFLNMTTENRITHARMTWGEYLGPLPQDYPTLGIRFRQGSLTPSRTGHRS